MPYSTIADIETVISELATELTTDDTGGTTLDSTNANACIEKVDSIIDLNLRRLYSAANLATSTWVKWCSATLASCQLFKRRGNPCPESLGKECEEYMETLKEIARGRQQLPDIAYTGNHYPTVTNLTVDMRFARACIRRVQATSNDPTPDPPASQDNSVDAWRS